MILYDTLRMISFGGAEASVMQVAMVLVYDLGSSMLDF
jgi:hypothetical protein